MNFIDGHSSEPLTDVELEQLAHIVDKKNCAMLALGYGTGIKVSEVIQVNGAVIDHSKQSVRIWDPKWNRHREPYISPTIMKMLRQFEETNHKDGMWFPHKVDVIQHMVPELTKKELGHPKTWQALRRTFVKSFQSAVPMQQLVENTGEYPDSIYRLFERRSYDYHRFEDPFSFLNNSPRTQEHQYRVDTSN